MIQERKPFICLELADKSLYDLFLQNEKGEKSLVLTPAREGQEKSQISLYDCSEEPKELLREILLENKGDMHLSFSFSHDFLSYSVRNALKESVTEGLIDLGKDDMELPISNLALPLGASQKSYRDEEQKITTRESGKVPKRSLLILSVLLSFSLLLWSGFILAKKSTQTSYPPLVESTLASR